MLQVGCVLSHTSLSRSPPLFVAGRVSRCVGCLTWCLPGIFVHPTLCVQLRAQHAPPSSNSVLLPFRGWRVVGGGERGTRSLAPGLFGRARLYPGSCARECTAEGAVCPHRGSAMMLPLSAVRVERTAEGGHRPLLEGARWRSLSAHPKRCAQHRQLCAGP